MTTRFALGRTEVAAAHDLLATLTAPERIKWAVATFGPGTFALTSAGADAALTLSHLAAVRDQVVVIHIDTGAELPETIAHRDAMQQRFGLNLRVIGPDPELTAELERNRSWESDRQGYDRLTKVVPLSRAIDELNVTCLISGIRASQTPNRARRRFVDLGNDGEVRLSPFLDWTEQAVTTYFSEHALPRHPLWHQGYRSIGNIHTTTKGEKRECGLQCLVNEPAA